MEKNKLKQIASVILLSVVAIIIGYTILMPNEKTDGKNSPLAVMLDNGNGGYNQLIVKNFSEVEDVGDYNYYGYECSNAAVTLSYDSSTGKFSYSGPAGSSCKLYYKLPQPGGTISLSTLRQSTNGGTSFSSISAIPTARNYKVTPTCTGATGEWNYETWSLDISSISSASPTCSIDFTLVDGTNLTPATAFSSTSGDYLYKKVQANAINKTSDTATASNMIQPNATWSIVTDANITAELTGTWSHTSGTGVWTTNLSAAGTNYIKLTTTSAGIYKVCYTIPSDTTNYLMIFKANTTGTSVTTSNGIKVSGPSSGTTSQCYNYGYLASAKYMYVGVYYGTGNSTVSVYKTTNFNSTAGNAGNGGYRYQGENPNNYVKFNNELWRIIGTDSNNITRIIRNESVGGYAYNVINPNSTSGENWWSKTKADGTVELSNIAYVLNNYYYNSTHEDTAGMCQWYRSSATATVARQCDFRAIGIKEGYKSMIVDSTIYLGYSSTSTAAKALVQYEHTPTVGYSGGDLIWTGKVGLMYPSDYIYARSAPATPATGWLMQNGYEWTISPYREYSYAVCNVDYNGDINPNGAFTPHAVRPVVSLASTVYVVDGNGSIQNPYIISG